MGTRRRAARVASMAVLVVLVIGAQGGGDPYRPQQWHLDRIGAPSAWEQERGGGAVIAIVDSGVDLAHPDLADRLLRDADGDVIGWDFVDDDGQPQDEQGHGTMVAGIAAAALDNGLGVAGVAPDARIMPVRVLDEDGAGTGTDVDAGIRWAVDNGAHVVNLSLESVVPLPGTVISQAPVEAVRYAWEHGVVVVAAAGNSSSPFTDYPPSAPVVLVGATDRDDERAPFSDTGREDAVLAPGVEIVSTWCDTQDGTRPCDQDPARRYGRGDGTSFAAPQVAGAVALLRSLGLGPQEAVQRLRSTAVDLGPEGPDDQTGVGRLDVAAAVGPAPEPTVTAGPATGAADDDAPDAASPPADRPSPAATAAPPSSEPDPEPEPEDPSPTPEVTTVPAPGSEVQALETTEPLSVTVLRFLAAALVLATGGLVVAVGRRLG